MQSTRVFRARYNVQIDGAVLSCHDQQITVNGYGAEIRFEIDGAPVSFERIERVRQLAQSCGTFTRLSGPEISKSIGNKAATTLHRDLGRLGFTKGGDHRQLASEALEREISSFGSLSAADAQTVYGYACAQAGISSRVWAA